MFDPVWSHLTSLEQKSADSLVFELASHNILPGKVICAKFED